MQRARVRTESMVQRFAKKPISEGYDLWDCGYLFGALRLFLFKSESAPPFQMGPCVDAMAEISLDMGSDDDARETFAIAADKYKLIQQPILAELMRVKLVCMTDGPTAAKERLERFLKETDPEANGGGTGADMKTRSALARSYAYLAELLIDCAAAAPAEKEDEEDTNAEEPSAAMVEAASHARQSAELAVNLGWDRVHTGYLALGECYEILQELEKAREAYNQAVQHCPRYMRALERLLDVMKGLHAPSKELLQVIDQAIDAHPHANLLRERAFLLSETENDEAALKFLSAALEAPPLEEMESEASSETVATLLKAKAAILADGGKLKEALAAAKEAVAACPDDKEGEAMLADISSAIAA